MKNWIIYVSCLFSFSSFSAETLTIQGSAATKLANAFKKNGTDDVRGTYTVKSLLCRGKQKAGSPQPYTVCKYVTIAAEPRRDWNKTDMGTKNAYETLQSLIDGGVKTVQLSASDLRNKYIRKVQVKKVVCETNGNSCVVTL